MGDASGLIGTLGAGRPGSLEPSGFTTPDVVEVHRTLAGLRDAGVRWTAMEVSSHALDQRRVAGVRFRAAAFTNLSRDHLDYHGTLKAYGDAKARLFRAPGLGLAVINTGDEFGRSLITRVPADVDLVTVGPVDTPALARGRRLSLRSVEARPDGLRLTLGGSWGSLRLESPLLGRFNADNLALALGVLLALGVPPGEAVDGLGGVSAPPGRMESFGGDGQPLVVVDYAHTPDALAKALAAARVHCRGRLWCVFGCGGDRDPGKRPEMGRYAESLADRVVVTDDNPRGEEPAKIVADILAGFERPLPVRVEHDRRAAICLAVRQAARADVVLVAGKGHEDYQIVGDERRSFSDRDAVLDALGARP
jgi:UDP-N-acetylmuramoyl-L-alanyl-D-glutamate--2,6-diaminopimelate ligase